MTCDLCFVRAPRQTIKQIAEIKVGNPTARDLNGIRELLP